MSMLLARRIPKVADFGMSQIRRGLGLLTTTTTSSLPTSPCLLLPMDVVGDYPEGKVANLNFYDLGNKKRVTLPEQRIPESIHLSSTIGSSRGWLVLISEDDFTVHLTNIFHPSAPTSTHKVISLPRLLPPDIAPDYTKSGASLQVGNVSLSSPPDEEDEECIVAVKFWGNCMSLCRIGDSQWRHADSFSSRCIRSLVVYSNKDNTFYLTPTDTFLRKDDRNLPPPEPWFPFLTYYRQFAPLKQPKMGEYEYELLRRCTRTKDLVESPSGDFFIVVKYALNNCKDLDRKQVKTGTRCFMVYSRDPTTKVESYVQDIGDLCIFLGKNEPFCLSTSMYPRLEPNSIYFTEGNQVYLYNIANQTFCELTQEDGLISSIWIQPIHHK